MRQSLLPLLSHTEQRVKQLLSHNLHKLLAILLPLLHKRMELFIPQVVAKHRFNRLPTHSGGFSSSLLTPSNQLRENPIMVGTHVHQPHTSPLQSTPLIHQHIVHNGASTPLVVSAPSLRQLRRSQRKNTSPKPLPHLIHRHVEVTHHYQVVLRVTLAQVLHPPHDTSQHASPGWHIPCGHIHIPHHHPPPPILHTQPNLIVCGLAQHLGLKLPLHQGRHTPHTTTQHTGPGFHHHKGITHPGIHPSLSPGFLHTAHIQPFLHTHSLNQLHTVTCCTHVARSKHPHTAGHVTLHSPPRL